MAIPQIKGFLLFLLLTSGFPNLSLAAAAPECTLEFQELQFFLPEPVGPLGNRLSQNETAAIRKRKDTFYLNAREFAQTLGKEISNLILSRSVEHGKTQVIVALGGAEHLGTMFELYVLKYGLQKNIEIRYVPLSREIVQPWYAWGKKDRNDQRSGIGPVPEGFSSTSNKPVDPVAFKKYLQDLSLFDADKVLVLDTGFRGTVPEAIAYVVKSSGLSIPVEGILLAHTRLNQNTLPIFSANQSLGIDKEIASKWARILDGNNSRGLEVATRLDAFQRSLKAKPVSSEHNLVLSITPLNSSQEIQNYNSTLLGLWDGL